MRATTVLLLLGLLAVSAVRGHADDGADDDAEGDFLKPATCGDCIDGFPCPGRDIENPTCPPSGPDATIEKICDRIYGDNGLIRKFRATFLKERVFSAEECDFIVRQAERHANTTGGWLTDRHDSYPTTDLDTADIPSLSHFIRKAAHRRIFPLLEDSYGLPAGVLGINEAFIAKYQHDKQAFLAPHRDKSEFSFVITLNENYGCGGTLFLNERKTYKGQTGDVLLFSGRNKHMGLPVMSGTRYIIAGFLHIGSKYECDLHRYF